MLKEIMEDIEKQTVGKVYDEGEQGEEREIHARNMYAKERLCKNCGSALWGEIQCEIYVQ